MAGGRPSKFKKEYSQQLIQHMRMGKSYETFAAKLMVDPRQLYHWETQHEEFLQAKMLGTRLSLQWWEDLGQDGAQGVGGFNAIAWVFTMKCRFRQFGYRDRFEDEKPSEPKKLSMEELVQETKNLMTDLEAQIKKSSK